MAAAKVNEVLVEEPVVHTPPVTISSSVKVGDSSSLEPVTNPTTPPRGRNRSRVESANTVLPADLAVWSPK